MSDEKMREEFEDWMQSCGANSEVRDFCEKQAMFNAWRASRAAIEVELPSASEFDNPSGAWPVLVELRKSIESLGLKVKS